MYKYNLVASLHLLVSLSVIIILIFLTSWWSFSMEKIIAALRAGAESAGVPVYNCVLVAGSQSGVAAAERVGMPCIVLRRRLLLFLNPRIIFYWFG